MGEFQCSIDSLMEKMLQQNSILQEVLNGIDNLGIIQLMSFQHKQFLLVEREYFC